MYGSHAGAAPRTCRLAFDKMKTISQFLRSARNMPDSKIEFLLRLIDQAYDQLSWHGPNLRGSIRGLDHRVAARRPKPGRHNLWEIVVHAAYWKYAVRRRLLGQKRGSFPLKGSNWFVRPSDASPQAWEADVQLLSEMHQELRSAVTGFRAADLGRKRPGSKFSNFDLIIGIAAHDVYHAGQIQILKRLAKK
jgi:hypothetical protein